MYVTLLNNSSLFLPNVQELLGNANMGRMEKLNTWIMFILACVQLLQNLVLLKNHF